ncbi:MAG: hypothetical protein K0U74_09235 [Alphaproteobacteria bacterium]|nr:hypothetical protein [Alphaproteobacteria bacterium]
MLKAFTASQAISGLRIPASLCAVGLSVFCLLATPSSADSLRGVDFGDVTIEPVESSRPASPSSRTRPSSGSGHPRYSEYEYLLPDVQPSKPPVEQIDAPDQEGPELGDEPAAAEVVEDTGPEEVAADDPLMEAADAVEAAEGADEATQAAEAAPAWPDPDNLDIPELASENTEPAPSAVEEDPLDAASLEDPLEAAAVEDPLEAAAVEDPLEEATQEDPLEAAVAQEADAPESSIPELAGDTETGPELALEEPAVEPEPAAIKAPPAAAVAARKPARKAPAPKARVVKSKLHPDKTVAAKDKKQKASIYDKWAHQKRKPRLGEKKPHPLAAGYPEHFVVVCEAGCAKETAHVVYIEPRNARGPVNEKPIKKGVVAGTDSIDCVGGCYDGNHSYATVGGVNAPSMAAGQENRWLTSVRKAKPTAARKSAENGRWYDRIN